MDCKHEKLYGLDQGNAFYCKNSDCNKRFTKHEVVILTKAQHDLTQAVVEAAFRAWVSLKGVDTMGEFNGKMNKLKEALDALDKGE